MKRLLIILSAILLLGSQTMAEDAAYKHEFRLGWGDPISDILTGTGGPYYWKDYGPVDVYTQNKTTSIGHIFVDYTYNINNLIGVGFQFDFIPTWRQFKHPDGRDLTAPYFVDAIDHYRFSFMPTLRFSYFHSKLVTLYSSLGIGFVEDYSPTGAPLYWDENAPGTSKYDDVINMLGMAVDVTALGVQVGQNHWFGSFELGCMFNVYNDDVWDAPTRFLTAAIGYRF